MDIYIISILIITTKFTVIIYKCTTRCTSDNFEAITILCNGTEAHLHEGNTVNAARIDIVDSNKEKSYQAAE
mgnify:CR=1 FL=1